MIILHRHRNKLICNISSFHHNSNTSSSSSYISQQTKWLARLWKKTLNRWVLMNSWINRNLSRAISIIRTTILNNKWESQVLKRLRNSQLVALVTKPIANLSATHQIITSTWVTVEQAPMVSQTIILPLTEEMSTQPSQDNLLVQFYRTPHP